MIGQLQDKRHSNDQKEVVKLREENKKLKSELGTVKSGMDTTI